MSLNCTLDTFIATIAFAAAEIESIVVVKITYLAPVCAVGIGKLSVSSVFECIE
ncbi:hypothetical protein [Providencia manganoxydans]|uniref:hypothetical protein n=1 Tax=Providencia manganoxydans TaxID=2923283 RepID=UPI003B9DF1D7